MRVRGLVQHLSGAVLLRIQAADTFVCRAPSRLCVRRACTVRVPSCAARCCARCVPGQVRFLPPRVAERHSRTTKQESSELRESARPPRGSRLRLRCAYVVLCCHVQVNPPRAEPSRERCPQPWRTPGGGGAAFAGARWSGAGVATGA
eukprot:Amastigsp_a508954_358.p3 type:complete len:148 gc:universal Amastigsp_a508954_358:462-905(+)